MAVRLPWWLKITLKLFLSRMPIGYGLWRRLGVFKLGGMRDPAHAYNRFVRHLDRVAFPRRGAGFVALELGPGDSLFSALFTYTSGAAESYLIDVGAFATRDLSLYEVVAEFLSKKGLRIPNMEEVRSLEDLLVACRSHYWTSGLESLRAVPTDSVDFIWSQSVLQHIRRAEFLDTMLELRRVIRADGVCSHIVDLKDHLGGALNNLRLSRRLWEWDFVARSGFYTNRIRFSEMLSIFQQAGFKAEVLSIQRWDQLPTPRNRLSAGFRDLPEDELRISGFEVVLHPA